MWLGVTVFADPLAGWVAENASPQNRARMISIVFIGFDFSSLIPGFGFGPAIQWLGMMGLYNSLLLFIPVILALPMMITKAADGPAHVKPDTA